jgi:polygalacturonase
MRSESRIWLLAGLAWLIGPLLHAETAFNVRDFGATGQKSQDARPALQKAIDACAAAGNSGVVRFPPGQYTSGTLQLRSNLRIELQAGATLFATPDPAAYDYAGVLTKAALFYGENLENVSFSGQGIIDGQAEYEWKPDDLEHTFDHKVRMQKLGKPTIRPVPKGFPKREIFPHLLWLGRSTNITVSGLNLIHSPGWTIS